jgi:hypothetical protein
MSRDELWKVRAERAEAHAEMLAVRLRSIQGEIVAPDVILWCCPVDGCPRYTYGPDWLCIDHSHEKPVPVRMRQVAPTPTETPKED